MLVFDPLDWHYFCLLCIRYTENSTINFWAKVLAIRWNPVLFSQYLLALTLFLMPVFLSPPIPSCDCQTSSVPYKHRFFRLLLQFLLGPFLFRWHLFALGLEPFHFNIELYLYILIVFAHSVSLCACSIFLSCSCAEIPHATRPVQQIPPQYAAGVV